MYDDYLTTEDENRLLRPIVAIDTFIAVCVFCMFMRIEMCITGWELSLCAVLHLICTLIAFKLFFKLFLDKPLVFLISCVVDLVGCYLLCSVTQNCYVVSIVFSLGNVIVLCDLFYIIYFIAELYFWIDDKLDILSIKFDLLKYHLEERFYDMRGRSNE